MLAGAVAMIFSGALPLQEAYAAINLDLIFFLLGMFSIVAAMDLSGLLEYLTARTVRFSRTPQRALALVLFGMGLLSAFLVNDTLALPADADQTERTLDDACTRCDHWKRYDPCWESAEPAHRSFQWDSEPDARLSLLPGSANNHRTHSHISDSKILLSKGSCKICRG